MPKKSQINEYSVQVISHYPLNMLSLNPCHLPNITSKPHQHTWTQPPAVYIWWVGGEGEGGSEKTCLNTSQTSSMSYPPMKCLPTPCLRDQRRIGNLYHNTACLSMTILTTYNVWMNYKDPLTIQGRIQGAIMYCDKQELMTTMSIEGENVETP